MRIPARLARLSRSPSLPPVLVHAGSGAVFALANLVLARWLPDREYALLTLGLAFMHLGAPLAAVGLDGVAVRGRLAFEPTLLARVLGATLLVSLALGAAGAAYGIGRSGVAMIVAAGTAGGSATVAAAELQRRQRYGLALGVLQGPNVALLLGAGLVAATGSASSRLPLLVTTAGFAAGALAGWGVLLREGRSRADAGPIPWGEALSLAGTNASGSLMGQLDRLIVPQVLPLSALATYGALSAVAGSLFRVLQRGVGFALLPRLRAADGVAARRRLVAEEVRLVGAIALAGAAVIWIVMPVVEEHVLDGRYRFSPGLVLAVVVLGFAKILNAFTRAAVTALAEERELALVNRWGWAGVALAVGAAAAGARWGLTGVILGVGLGWLLRSAVTVQVMVRHLQPVGRGARAS